MVKSFHLHSVTFKYLRRLQQQILNCASARNGDGERKHQKQLVSINSCQSLPEAQSKTSLIFKMIELVPHDLNSFQLFFLPVHCQGKLSPAGIQKQNKTYR